MPERALNLRQPGFLADAVGLVRESPAGFARNRRRLILLVHGYNNSEAVARESFRGFTAELQRMGATGRAIAEDVAFAYWPGDWNMGTIISATSYPFQIPRAVLSGGRLGLFAPRACSSTRRAGRWPSPMHRAWEIQSPRQRRLVYHPSRP
jgi:hypothetical protein